MSESKHTIYGSLTALDREDVTRVLWTRTGEWTQASEVERLRGLIRAHNALCENACASRSDVHCEPWLTRGRWCPDCPREWMIDEAEDQTVSEPVSETCNHSFVTPDGGSWKAVALGECPWCEIERLRSLIREHNAECEELCAERSECEAYRGRGLSNDGLPTDDG